MFGFIFGHLILLHWSVCLFSLLMPALHSLDYCSFGVNFEIGKCPQLCSSFKRLFGHLGALHFHSAFQVQLVSFCREVYGYFSRGCKKSVVQFSIISWVPFLSSRFDFPLVELLSFSGSVKAYRNSLHFENVFISSLLLNDSDFSKLDLKFKSKSYFPCNLWRYYSIVFWHLLLLMRCLLSV